MLLELSRHVVSGYVMQLQMDTTFDVCRNSVNMLTIGLNELGARYHPISANLVHGGPSGENFIMYRNSWKATARAAQAILRDYKECPLHGCMTCLVIHRIRRDDKIKNFQKTKAYREVTWPVKALMGDDHHAIDAMADFMGVERDRCVYHKTGASSIIQQRILVCFHSLCMLRSHCSKKWHTYQVLYFEGGL